MSQQTHLVNHPESLPSIKESFVKICKLAAFPMVWMVFHPVYIIINVATCGRIGDTELAGFGLGSLTLGIMLISIGVCFSMALSTLVA